MMVVLKIIVGCILLYISIKDLATHKISNWTIVILLIVGMGATEKCPITVMDRIMGTIFTGGPLVLLNMVKMNAFGGGDIKLFMAAGGILGIRGGLGALCISFLTGGVYSAVMLITGRAKKSQKIPFGPFICIGIAFCFFFVNS